MLTFQTDGVHTVSEDSKISKDSKAYLYTKETYRNLDKNECTCTVIGFLWPFVKGKRNTSTREVSDPR